MLSSSKLILLPNDLTNSSSTSGGECISTGFRLSSCKRVRHGTSMVEMVVAIGVSGILIAALASLLSESLSLSGLGQNELSAAAITDLLLENARTMPYGELKLFADDVPRDILINTATVGQIGPDIRKLPAQLTFVDDTFVFGEVDPQTGSIITGNRWTSSKNNAFSGKATVTVTDSTSSTVVPSYKVTVEVSYAGAFASSNGKASAKKLKRSAFVFKGGSQF